jgi:pyruvate formate lyase activating enzyme
VEPGTERYLSRSTKLSPEETVELAKQYDCRGIAWTYNEPTIWFEYSLETAKVAKQAGLYTCYITNGYLTADALDALGPYLDGYRVDVKGFTTEFYRELASVAEWRGVLDIAVRAKYKWDMHVEVITNIIPTMNDDDEQLRALARWIVEDLGELTPWHVTRFFPYLELSHLSPTLIQTLDRAREIGLEQGLRFVYVGNVPGHDAESTYCYNCGKLVIQRVGYQTRMVDVQNGKCGYCGADLNIK